MRIDPYADSNDELRPEYTEVDLKNSVRGKYADRLRRDTAIIELDPDVASIFATQEEVNTALRFLMKLTQENPLTAKKLPAPKFGGGAIFVKL